MSLTTVTEITHSQIPFGQVGNSVSSSGVFRRQSVEQITDTEISYCNISFSDFANVFRFGIAQVIWDGFSDQIVFKLEYTDNFYIYLKLTGYWELQEESKFQLTNVDWNFEEKVNSPTSAFMLETFKVILCLSNKVKVEIPNIDYYFGVSVPLPLNNISEILQNRQIAYRLMVIEKAFQKSLPFPRRFIKGEEVENIAFSYFTIVEKQFEWACDSLTVFPPATKENSKYFPLKNNPYHLIFPTLNETRVIFNHKLLLGQFMIGIEQAVVENYEEARENFAKFDNQPVKVVIRSLNGKIKYTSLNSPSFSQRAWKKDVQALASLDEKLNSVFLERYFKLAASTLDGLSEKQKKSITERPKLSIHGFD